MEEQESVLVTGGSGYLGVQCILHLLLKQYAVKTTIRTESKKKQVLESLKAGGINNFDKLSFIEADLTSDKNWDIAVKGCKYVLHVASPFPAVDPENEDEVIIPARDGVLRVLKASEKAGVKRVVLTSSFAAIGFSKSPKNHLFTEKDWTDVNVPLTPYIKSKAIAEKAAWDFIKNEGKEMELTVINPVGIFGPLLAGNYSASIEHALLGILNGDIKETPKWTFNIVDVRDTADIHLAAMTNPKAAGERFLVASGEAMSFFDIAALISKERPQRAANISPSLKPIDADFYVHLSTDKAETILGWAPRSKEETILETVDTLDISKRTMLSGPADLTVQHA